MALTNAITFLNRISVDSAIRSLCYTMESKPELLKLLGFTEAEFEDAVNISLLKCQSQEEANKIQELKFWFFLL